jgi:hypothetical protein
VASGTTSRRTLVTDQCVCGTPAERGTDRCRDCRRWQDEGELPTTLRSARAALEELEAHPESSIDYGRTLGQIRNLVATLEARGGRHAARHDPNAAAYRAGGMQARIHAREVRDVAELLRSATARLREVEARPETSETTRLYWRGYVTQAGELVAGSGLRVESDTDIAS